MLGIHLLPIILFSGLSVRPSGYEISHPSNKTITNNLICAVAQCRPGQANYKMSIGVHLLLLMRIGVFLLPLLFGGGCRSGEDRK